MAFRPWFSDKAFLVGLHLPLGVQSAPHDLSKTSSRQAQGCCCVCFCRWFSGRGLCGGLKLSVSILMGSWNIRFTTGITDLNPSFSWQESLGMVGCFATTAGWCHDGLSMHTWFVGCPGAVSIWDAESAVAIWRFPKVELRPNHPKLDHFSIETHGFGIPHFKNPHLSLLLHWSIRSHWAIFNTAQQNKINRSSRVLSEVPRARWTRNC